MSRIDRIFKGCCCGCAALAVILMAAFFLQMGIAGGEAWGRFGLGFLTSADWDPGKGEYGALAPMAGTLATTAIALALAVPPAFAAALFLTEAPPKVGAILGNAIDLLAAIPSVIYGMWGLFVLAPAMQTYIQPFFNHCLFFDRIPLLGGASNGFGIFTAGVILAIMVLPFLCAIMRDVLKMTPPVLKEAAYGLGCTRLEATKDVVMRYGLRGLLGAVFIGIGRALGETMAVLFVIGNQMQLPKGLFDSGSTIASTLANSFAEATGLERSALFALGTVLLGLSFAIQLLAHCYLNAVGKVRK